MLAVACARHAATLGLVTFDEAGNGDGDAFIAHMPNKPDTAVMFMPTGGESQPTLAPTDLPTVQILVRGPKHDPRPALQLWHALYDVFTCLDGVWLDEGGDDAVYVVGCTAAQSGPVPMGVDENGRHEFSLNLRFRTHAPTAHRPEVFA